MELNEFVEVTLRQIIEGVAKAQETTRLQNEGVPVRERNLVNPILTDASGGKGLLLSVNDSVHMIDFDVAVTSSSNEGAKAGANLSVAGFGFGGDLEESKSDTVVNRIKFQVPVKYPQK